MITTKMGWVRKRNHKEGNVAWNCNATRGLRAFFPSFISDHLCCTPWMVELCLSPGEIVLLLYWVLIYGQEKWWRRWRRVEQQELIVLQTREGDSSEFSSNMSKFVLTKRLQQKKTPRVEPPKRMVPISSSPPYYLLRVLSISFTSHRLACGAPRWILHISPHMLNSWISTCAYVFGDLAGII